MAAPALRVTAVHRGFGNVGVLAGVDLHVEADELVALVGQNGTGKTTLVRCIAGGLQVQAGTIDVLGRPVGHGAQHAEGLVDIVWQDLALCDNLDVVDNLFLGREPGRVLRSAPDRQVRARELLEQLGVHIPELTRPVAGLSGGQRQSVALARTLVRRPALLILDEPTAALDSAGVGALDELIRLMRAAGTAILLISHDLDLVSQVADRALVLRGGVITADVRRPHLTADELRARMSGLEDDALARRQLHGLRSLVDQLGEVRPSAVVPMVVSAVSVALDQPRMALHLLADDGGAGQLELAAGLGLTGPLRDALATVDLHGAAPQARAVDTRAAVVDADLRGHADPTTAALVPLGVRSTWTVPLVGGSGVLGTLSGYGDARGSLPEGALELAALYASHAAAAIERDRLLTTVTRRNRTLETLRQVLETLAGPESDDVGLAVALEALRVGLGAQDLALVDLGVDGTRDDGGTSPTVRLATMGDDGTWALAAQLPPTGDVSRSTTAGSTVLAATVAERDERRSLLARWRPGESPRPGAHELLVDGAHSVLLALERRAHEAARREAATLRRSADLQRTFLSRLSHELRTPLTAIHGYADSLRQPDVDWDGSTTRRFLDTIARESDRLGHLVTDLLDASAIEAGVLRLQPDWCELPLVVERAIACVPAPSQRVLLDMAPGLPPIRADHDRLEQALVNLIGNAVAHTPDGTCITVTAAPGPPGQVELVVADDGPGLPDVVAASLFVAGIRGDGAHGGAGLGLAITRGIVAGHGGTIDVDSTPTGTTFRIRLPVDGPSDGSPAWSLSAEAADPPALREAGA